MSKYKIAALIFPDFEMLDLYGPLEMFSMYPDVFEIVTVAERAGPVRAAGGPATVAQAGFADGDAYDVLLVPGGAGTRAGREDETLVGWLTGAIAKARITSSVCTGTALLAATGALDGRRATTNKLAFDRVADDRPQVDWQRSARWVEDGPFYTASGVSAGCDMALALIAHLQGDKAATDAALWAEYTWNRDPDDDPFANCKDED